MSKHFSIRNAAIWLLVAALTLTHAHHVSARSNLIGQARAEAHAHDYDRAIADLSQAIAQDPSDTAAYEVRAMCYLSEKEKKYDLARADFDYSIIRLDPRSGRAYQLRGATYYREHQYANAKADFAKAIELNPEDPKAYNAAAWLMATCPDAKFRDGPKAIELAGKSCEITSWRLPSTIDTLAAAYAEDGKFDDAIKSENQAIEIWSSRWRHVDASIKAARDRLELYQAGKPYRAADE
jgi:tetratricopeptide (TPR) repeat protein